MKLTIWATSAYIYDELTSAQRIAIDQKAKEPFNKGLAIKNNTSWAIIYIETTEIASTTAGWYPIEYGESISLDLAELQYVSIISDTVTTDVRILTI